MTSFLIDSHVHLYPCFDINKAINKSWNNFASIEKKAAGINKNVKRVWLLTERSDMHMFTTLFHVQLTNYTPKPGKDNCLYLVEKATEKALIIFPGRQIITHERLEICALGCDVIIQDRLLSTRDVIIKVLDQGGIPAVNWAPGKWFGKRGRLVSELFDQFSPEELLISDTTMRPAVWTTPRLISAARRQGFQMVCGSDPLPFPGEEKWLGSYCTLASGTWNDDRPLDSLKNLLLQPQHSLRICGNRSGLLSFINRQYKIMKKNK